MSRPYLGSCCVCGGFKNVNNVLCLPVRAPVEGVGCWGCLVCGLPNAGAVAVVCDTCFEGSGTECHPKVACIGAPGDNKRITLDLLKEPFRHGEHPEGFL